MIKKMVMMKEIGNEWSRMRSFSVSSFHILGGGVVYTLQALQTFTYIHTYITSPSLTFDHV